MKRFISLLGAIVMSVATAFAQSQNVTINPTTGDLKVPIGPIALGFPSGYLVTGKTGSIIDLSLSTVTLPAGTTFGTLTGVLKANSGVLGTVTIGSSLSYSGSTLNTIQGIRTADSPTFTGVTAFAASGPFVTAQSNDTAGNPQFVATNNQSAKAILSVGGSAIGGTIFGVSNNGLASIVTAAGGVTYPSGLAIGTGNNAPVIFGVNNTEVGRITSTGLNNTTIGATTPLTGNFTQVTSARSDGDYEYLLTNNANTWGMAVSGFNGAFLLNEIGVGGGMSLAPTTHQPSFPYLAAAGVVLNAASTGALSTTTAIPVGYFDSGTNATNHTYWRGDGTWQTFSDGGGNISNVGIPVSGQIAQWTGETTVQGINTVPGSAGGTGVANTGKIITLGGNVTTTGGNLTVSIPTNATVTLGGNLTISGAYATTLTSTAATSVTLPTSGTLVGSADTGTVTNTMLADTTLQGLAQPGLFNFWNKLAKIGAVESNVRAVWVVSGDSLGNLQTKYITPALRTQYGQAGCFGLFGYNDTMFPSGTVSSYTADDDFTTSPLGVHTTIQSGAADTALAPWSSSPSVYPYSPVVGVNGLQENVTSVTVYYTVEPSAGTFKVQYQALGSATWVDVSGLTSISAAGTLALGIGSASISATTITNIRALWLSGNAVKVIGAKLLAASSSGVVVYNLSRGSMDMGQFAASPLTAAFLTDLGAPDLVTLAARDTAAIWLANLTAFDALWASTATTDRLFFGINEAAADTPSPTFINSYNAITQAFCAARSYLYFDLHKYQPSYTLSNARGWMADATHPNDNFNSAVFDPLEHVMLIDQTPYAKVWRTFPSQTVTFPGGLYSSGATAPTSATTGSNVFLSGLATSGPIYTNGIFQGPNLTLRGAAIQEEITNASTTVSVNFSGYANSTTQFRDLTIYNGKNARVALFSGSTKLLTLDGSITSTGTSTSFFSGSLNTTQTTASGGAATVTIKNATTDGYSSIEWYNTGSSGKAFTVGVAGNTASIAPNSWYWYNITNNLLVGSVSIGTLANTTHHFYGTVEATTGGAGSYINDGGIFAAKAIVSGSATASTTTATGSGIFAGGVGVGGAINAGGDISTQTIGKTFAVKSGSNALSGTVTLTAGAGTISSTAIDANTVISISLKPGGASGVITQAPYLDTATAGTGATVKAGAGDNSTYNWVGLKVN